MKKLLFVLILFLFLIFTIISIYNTLACVSKQTEVQPINKMQLEESVVLKHLQGALRVQLLSNPIDSLQKDAYKQMQDYLELTFREIYKSPNIEIKKLEGKGILLKWVGRNPKLTPILLLGQLDVKDPALKEIPQWTYNPFLGKIVDNVIYGAGVMGGKSVSIAMLEALETHIAAGVLPERTLYIAFSYDQSSDSSKSIQLLAKTLASNGLKFEAIIGQESYATEIMDLSKPVAMLQCAERHKIYLNIEGKDFSQLTKLVERIHSQIIPIARKKKATRQFLLNLLPELSFSKRWALCNWTWAGFLMENELDLDKHVGAMLRSTCDIEKLEKGIDGQPSVAQLSWSLSPDYSLADIQKKYATYLSAVNAKWSEELDAHPLITNASGYSYEVLSTTIRQVMGDVYVMPSIGANSTGIQLFKGLSPNCYQIRPYLFKSEDLECLRSGIDQQLRVDAYLDAVRFYHQLMDNMLL